MSADSAIFEIQHKRQQSHDSGTYQDWPHDEIKPDNPEFVTVVAVENTVEATDKNFVTVLSIEPHEEIEAEPEDVLVYRLPGERLGFGLKFEGGVKTVEKVGKLFIQSCALDSPASRTSASWGPLSPGDEIIAIDGVFVSDMTRIDCVRALKESNVVIKLQVRQGKQNLKSETKVNQPQQDALAPPIPPRKFPRKKDAIEPPQGFDDKKTSPPVMPRSRYIVPQAEVYTDLLSQECHIPTESESDDTGSSISTVVSRISSTPTTSNSSFSDVRSINSMDITSPPSPTSKNTPFDLDKVLEPFLQLEREFSSSAIEDSSIFSKLVEASNLIDQKDESTLKPPESFQDDEENQTAYAPELPPKPCPRQDLEQKWKNGKRRPPPPPPPPQRTDRPVCPDPRDLDVSSHLPRLIDFVPKDRTDVVVPNPVLLDKDVDERDSGLGLDNEHEEAEPAEQNHQEIPVSESTPQVTDMEENLSVASQPFNGEPSLSTTSCETLSTLPLPPPSFSRLPPDGHEFPVHYEETGVRDAPPIPETRCKPQYSPPTRNKESIKRGSPTETTYLKHAIWRNDEKSEKSVRDKIAMFSTVVTQQKAASPPTLMKKMHKFKSSDDVSSRISHSEQVKAPIVKQAVPVLPFHSLLDVSRDFDGNSLSRKTSSRTQSTTDLSAVCFDAEPKVEYSTLPRKSEQKPSSLEMRNGCQTPSLSRAVSFSGNTKLHSRSQSLVDVGSKSHFFHSKSTEEARRSSLNHLIEQRKKSMSKLRGLVIPEKVIENPVTQFVADLPEIKSKDCLITNMPAAKPNAASQGEKEPNLQQINKSVPVMPVPPWKADNSCDLPKYSPAFKRKSLALYSGTSTTGSTVSSVASSLSSSREELRSCFSDGPRTAHPMNRVNLSSRNTVSPSQSHSETKSLESITSPVLSDLSFEYVNTSVSPHLKNNEILGKYGKGTESKVNCEGRAIEEESDNDSAVSSSRSSVSHGYSPPHSPVHGFGKLDNNSNCLNYSGNGLMLKRTLSSETTASTSSNGSTLTSGSQASCSSMSTTSSIESKRVLKPQSVEAINRKNVLSSAKYSSGLDIKTGYPIPPKSSNDEENSNEDQCQNSSASLKSVSPITVIENEVVDPEENPVEEPSIEQESWSSTNGDTPDSPAVDFNCQDKIESDSLSPIETLSPSANDNESLEFSQIDSGDKKEFINSSPKSYVKDWRDKESFSRNCIRSVTENGNKNYDFPKTLKPASHKNVNVNNIKKVFEKVDNINVSNGRLKNSVSNINLNVQHPRVSSIDSTTSDDSYVPTQNTPYGSVTNLQKEQQFGSITSLASSTSLISQQELSQLIEEANHTLEDGGNSHEVVVVILHRDTPGGSIGITLAGGADYEAKEITVHKVLVGSPAERDGRIQKGDRILSINGKSMKGLTHYESLAILKAPRPEVVLVVSRHKVETPEESLPRAFGNMRSAKLSESKYSSLPIDKGSETKWGPVVTVVLNKDGAGLGFSLDGGKDSPFGDQPLTVKKIFTGGCAEKCGQLFAGDELISVNNIDLSELSRIEAWALMKRLPDGKVHLNIRHPVA